MRYSTEFASSLSRDQNVSRFQKCLLQQMDGQLSLKKVAVLVGTTLLNPEHFCIAALEAKGTYFPDPSSAWETWVCVGHSGALLLSEPFAGSSVGIQTKLCASALRLGQKSDGFFPFDPRLGADAGQRQTGYIVGPGPAKGQLCSGSLFTCKPGEGITRALGCGARSAESALIYELRLSHRRRLRG